jgi:PhnB protein
MSVKPVPDELAAITPQLVVRDAPRALAFYKEAFGAHELYRNTTPDGAKVVHAELLLGSARFFVHDEFPQQGLVSPAPVGASVTLHLYVEDVDAFFARATRAGAEVVDPVADRFWGDRYGILRDPFGHRWSFASRIEDLSPRETTERNKQYFSENR